MNFDIGLCIYYLLRLFVAFGGGVIAWALTSSSFSTPIVVISIIIGLFIGWWATSRDADKEQR